MTKLRVPALSISSWQVISAMTDGVVITDPSGTIMAANDAFCAVTGYARAEILGRNPRLLRSGKHDRAFYARMWRAVRQNGLWQGEIWNRRKNGELYPEWLTISAIKDRWGRTQCFLGVARDLTSPKLDEERLKHLAQYDQLTGLPNRRLFLERLRRVLANRASGGNAAVLFLDLDRFKDINDQWGHAAGDAFLQVVSARLRGCVRHTDTVARWSGDEFSVMLNPVSGRDDAARVARKILRVMRRPYTVHGRRTKVSASIGVCMCDGRSSPDRLISKADQAMYEVKKVGRDDVRFWLPAVSLRRRSRAPPRGAAAPTRGRTGVRRRPRPLGVNKTTIRAS